LFIYGPLEFKTDGLLLSLVLLNFNYYLEADGMIFSGLKDIVDEFLRILYFLREIFYF